MSAVPFFDGQPVLHSHEICLDEVDGVHVQKTADLKNFLLAQPNPPRFTTAAVAWTVRTGGGIKAKIKSIFPHDAHGHVSFLLLSSCASRYRLTSSPLPNPPSPPAATTRCHGKIRGRGFLPMACPTARAPFGFPAMAATSL